MGERDVDNTGWSCDCSGSSRQRGVARSISFSIDTGFRGVALHSISTITTHISLPPVQRYVLGHWIDAGLDRAMFWCSYFCQRDWLSQCVIAIWVRCILLSIPLHPVGTYIPTAFQDIPTRPRIHINATHVQVYSTRRCKDDHSHNPDQP